MEHLFEVHQPQIFQSFEIERGVGNYNVQYRDCYIEKCKRISTWEIKARVKSEGINTLSRTHEGVSKAYFFMCSPIFVAYSQEA